MADHHTRIQEQKNEAVETASQVPRPLPEAEVPKPLVVVSEVTEISSEISAPVTSITLTKFSMSSLSDKPVAATKTESAFEKTAPPKDTNDVEPKSATESLFGPSAEEEPAPQTEIPAKASTAEPDPVTDFVYEPSPEEPIPVTDSVFVSQVEPEGATEMFESALVDVVPATEAVWDPSTEEASPVISISSKSSSADLEQRSKTHTESPVVIPATGSTVEIAPEDFNPQTEILFETASPDPVKEREEQTDLTSHALPITEIPFEVSSVEPEPITETLFKSLQKPPPTTESMDELSQDFTLENETDSVHEHPRISDAVLETELPTTALLDTELSFDSHENIIPRTEIPHVGSAEYHPKTKIVTEAPLETLPEIPQVEYVTNLSPLESIVTDNTHDGVTVETETQLGNANETKDTPEELGHSLDIAGREHILPQNTIVKSVDSEDVLLAESQQNVIPQIPVATEEVNIALLDVWKEALSHSETNSSGAVTGREHFIILYPIDFTWLKFDINVLICG